MHEFIKRYDAEIQVLEQKYAQCLKLWFCLVTLTILVDAGEFYPYYSGLLHWHRATPHKAAQRQSSIALGAVK